MWGITPHIVSGSPLWNLCVQAGYCVHHVQSNGIRPVNKSALIIVSILLLAVAGIFAFKSESAPTVVVYKSATCGCCSSWIEHLEEAGFNVEAHDVEDMTATKKKHGVPSKLGSCHTAVIDGYVIEGHVPAEDITRLLLERPDIAGLSVPGMPIGSPGMEQGSPANYHDYVVVAFDGSGETSVYRSVRGSTR